MKRAAILATICLSVSICPSVSMAQRGPAAPPPQLTPEQKSQYQARIDALDAMVKSFRAARVNEDLIADVDIYAKAGKWLLEFPQGFANAQAITNYLAVLDQGLERGKLLQQGQSPWVAEKGRKVLGYYSPLDGSVQPMGVTIPDSYDASKPDRLYVWLHGRNNGLTEANFINGFKNAPRFPNTAYTADVGQLTLDCYGRGNNANHQAGEVDIFEGITAMQRRFKIDPDRVILRGFSLGGAAAWHIALQYPDRWAAAEVGAGTYPGRLMYAAAPFPPYQNGPLHIYENIIEWALNAYNLPLAGHDGDADDQVATVGAPRGSAPTPNRGQLESSLRVRAQLAKEGFPSEGPEGNWTVPGTRDIFLISSNTKHGVNQEVKTRLDAFLKQYGDEGRKDPDHIKFVTYTTRYNQCFWISLDGLDKLYERAEVDAQRTDAGQHYQIATKNLARLTLRETSQASSIQIDGQTLKVRPSPEIVIEKTAGNWKLAKSAKWTGLHKTHGLQGPIDDAFLDPFLLVRPTGTPWNAAAHAYALRMLEHFDREWTMNYRGHPRIKDDKDVPPADFANYNVVLFGDPGSNSWIAKMHSKLPLKWTKEAIAVGGQSFPAAENLPVLAYPNPLSPSHYVVLNTGLTISDQDYNGDYAMPRFGDIAVLKIKDPAAPPEIAWAALFDQSWQLPKH
ncbi:MAG TPA: alpha/beta hydrolase [Bryobacteraceae bacterium]|nr:alpha/beta hydrolase [Bryobacteraceae bacterium]